MSKQCLQCFRQTDSRDNLCGVCRPLMIAKRRAVAQVEKEQWERMKAYFNQRCLCCAQRAFSLTKDHVIPKSRGGPNSLENYQPLCMACNLQKGAETVDYRWRGWREALSLGR